MAAAATLLCLPPLSNAQATTEERVVQCEARKAKRTPPQCTCDGKVDVTCELMCSDGSSYDCVNGTLPSASNVVETDKLCELMGAQSAPGSPAWKRRIIIKGVPPTTFPIIMRWFLIQIAYNTGNVAKTDKVVRTNGGSPLPRTRRGPVPHPWSAFPQAVFGAERCARPHTSLAVDLGNV